MTGTFIISLDCEGKWGFADRIGPQHEFMTEASLAKAYEILLRELARYDMKATFAFVGAFTLTESERLEHKDLFRDTIYRGRNWLHNYRLAERDGALDGWFCPSAFEMVRASSNEVASHGFSHLPFDDPEISKADLNTEIASAVTVAQAKGLRIETFVYPRNLVGHTDILRDNGFVGFRDGLQRVNRIAPLASEFNVFSKSQPHARPGSEILVIPPGYFLNWRHGVRRAVPKFVTVTRWASILKSAAKNGEVAHLWLHPHNIIDGPETLSTMTEVLRIADALREKGKLNVLTQAEYAQQRRG